MKVERFEELQVWIDSRKLVAEVYRLTLNDRFKKDFGLKEQIQRSAVSVISNIAEGFERHNNKEFIRFLIYAKSSAGELRAQLYVAVDIGYISRNEFEKVFKNTVKISQQLANFIKYLRKS
ncbi:MAG: four helix bundle protein [Elusimicrobia bacterium]|nr:four helix bundle protein [Elusimicrobiota bacterium]